MKVYDVNDNLLAEDDKDFEYSEDDGYTYEDSRVIKHHEAIEYQPEIRDERPEAAIVLAEYPNGGKDIEQPILQEEVEAKDAWDETEEIFRYIEYPEEEKQRKRDAEVAQAQSNQLMRGVSLFVMSTPLTDEQAMEVSTFYDDWAAGINYNTDDIRRYEGILYRCLQRHSSLDNWMPPVVPALWHRLGNPNPEGIWPWVQPPGAPGYMKGDEITHLDSTWISDIDNNVWEPGVYGWKKQD